MITNTHRGDFCSIPLHRLEKESHTIAWIRKTGARELLRATLHRMYPEGVGVCSDSCLLMSYINPSGGIRDVPYPWPAYPIYLMVNNPKPKAGSERICPCVDFWDPEVGGPWGDRMTGEHHPFCMYNKGAPRRYQYFVELGRARSAQGLSAVPDRPDAWFRSAKEIE